MSASWQALKNAPIPKTIKKAREAFEKLTEIVLGQDKPPKAEVMRYFAKLYELKTSPGNRLLAAGGGPARETVRQFASMMDVPFGANASKDAILESISSASGAGSVGGEGPVPPEAEEPAKPPRTGRQPAVDVPVTIEQLTPEQRELYDRMTKTSRELFEILSREANDLDDRIENFNNDIFIPFQVLQNIRNAKVNPKAVSKGISALTDDLMQRVADAAVKVAIGDYNWCGPGTDIFGNIMQGKMPVNALDEACMDHDLDYLRAGALHPPGDERERIVAFADKELVKRAKQLNELHKDKERDSEEFKMAGAAGKVATLIQRGSEAGITKRFADAVYEPMPIDMLEQIDDRLIRIARTVADRAEELNIDGAEEITEAARAVEEADRAEKAAFGIEPQGAGAGAGEPVGERLIDPADPPKPSAAAEVEEEKKEETVAETTPVMTEEELRKLNPPDPVKEMTKEEIERAKMPPAPGQPVVGERSMRPLLFRREGDDVEPTRDEKRQNLLWLENFTWIDEGHGLGNQQRVPWELGGGLSKNTLFNAQQRNQMLKYSGSLYVGDQQVRRVKQPSKRTVRFMRPAMIPTSQNRQKFIRNGPLPAGMGRPIKMKSGEPPLYSALRVADPGQRLVYPDVVDGRRV